jgi:hypothetical protein
MLLRKVSQKMLSENLFEKICKNLFYENDFQKSLPHSEGEVFLKPFSKILSKKKPCKDWSSNAA